MNVGYGASCKRISRAGEEAAATKILRLSPHLFWLGGFTHGAFSSAQDDDTRGRKGSHLGDTLHVLELAVLYTIRVGLWRRGAPKAQDGSTKRCEKLCETIRFP